MSKNYASALPHDEGGNVMQGYPAPVLAKATTVIVSGISSVITFNNNSTDIEIASPNTSAALKWIGIGAQQTSVIASSLGTSNFDHIIPSGTIRKFVIPQETGGTAGPALANSVYGLYQRAAVIPVGNTVVSSILVTEY